MEYQIVWNALMESIIEIFPEFSTRKLVETDSLKSLGANSIDRADVIMSTMSRLKLKVPMVTFAAAKNIGELSSIFLKMIELRD